jgi:hypothetical protein
VSEQPPRAEAFPSQPARWLHLVAVSSLAVLQPVLDQIGAAPTFLVHHGATTPRVVLLVAALALVPATLLWTVQAAAAAAKEALGRAALFGGLGCLVLLAALPALRRTGLGDAGSLVGALGVAVLAAAGYRRWSAVRSYVSLLALGALVFPLAFFWRGDVRAALGGAAGAALQEGTATSPEIRLARPVVIVLFDELPLQSLLDDGFEIDGRAFPSFARLAATSTWFRNFTTSHNETIGALPALLTGRRVARAPPVTHASHPHNLLAAVPVDQRHAVFESETRLLPAGAAPAEAWSSGVVLADVAVLYGRSVLPASLARRLPEVGERWGHFWSGATDSSREGADRAPAWAVDERAQRFAELLDRLEAVEEPGLFYAHVMLPHSPWQILPSGRLYRWRGLSLRGAVAPPLSRLSQRAADPAYLRLERQRHLLQLQFADRLLGLLLDRLEATGRLDDTVLAVLSDHGRSFTPARDGRSLEGNPDPEAVLRVPLFVKQPGQRSGRAIDRNVESIDFLSTLAEAAGFVVSWPTEGESGYQEGPGRPTKICHDRHGREHRFAGQLEWSAAVGERDIEAAIAGDPFRFFRLGPYRHLVGRALDTLEVEAAGGAELTLAGGEALAHYDSGASVRPVYLLGRARWPMPDSSGAPVEGSDPAVHDALHLAFALAGRIVAVTQTLAPVELVAGQATADVAVLLPEDELVAGSNELAVYTVAGLAAAPRLRRVTGLSGG